MPGSGNGGGTTRHNSGQLKQSNKQHKGKALSKRLKKRSFNGRYYCTFDRLLTALSTFFYSLYFISVHFLS